MDTSWYSASSGPLSSSKAGAVSDKFQGKLQSAYEHCVSSTIQGKPPINKVGDLRPIFRECLETHCDLAEVELDLLEDECDLERDWLIRIYDTVKDKYVNHFDHVLLKHGHLTKNDIDTFQSRCEGLKLSPTLINQLVVERQKHYQTKVDPLDNFRSALEQLQSTLHRHAKTGLYASFAVVSIFLLAAGVKTVNNALPRSNKSLEAFERLDLIDGKYVLGSALHVEPSREDVMIAAVNNYYEQYLAAVQAKEEDALAAAEAAQESSSRSTNTVTPSAPASQGTSRTTRQTLPRSQSSGSTTPAPGSSSPPSPPAPQPGSAAQESPTVPEGSPLEAL